jgi:hypothetical protein
MRVPSKPRRRWSPIRPMKPGHYWSAFRAKRSDGWLIGHVYISSEEAECGGKSWGASHRFMPCDLPRPPAARRRPR